MTSFIRKRKKQKCRLEVLYLADEANDQGKAKDVDKFYWGYANNATKFWQWRQVAHQTWRSVLMTKNPSLHEEFREISKAPVSA